MGGERKIKYTDEVMETLHNLILSGYSNTQIYDFFELPQGYSSMSAKLAKLRKELDCPIERFKSTGNSSEVNKTEGALLKDDDSNNIGLLSLYISNVDVASSDLNNAVAEKLKCGFKSSDIAMAEAHSKRIANIIARLENTMFLLDNIVSINKKE